MKQINPMLTGITLLLFGIALIVVNYFILNNPLYGRVGLVGIFCVVAGLAVAILNSLRKKD